jgi:hypothetical protein
LEHPAICDVVVCSIVLEEVSEPTSQLTLVDWPQGAIYNKASRSYAKHTGMDNDHSNLFLSNPILSGENVDITCNQGEIIVQCWSCAQVSGGSDGTLLASYQVKHKNQSAYQRLRALCSSSTKRFYVFANEHHRDTFIQAEPSESPNDRNDRAIRVATKWYVLTITILPSA